MLKLILGLFILCSVLEFGVETKALWSLRKFLGDILIALLALLSIATIFCLNIVLALTFIFFSLYRIINLQRVVAGRTEAQYLRKVALRSSLTINFFQTIVFAIFVVFHRLNIHTSYWYGSLLVVETIFVLILLRTSLRNFKKTLPRHSEVSILQKDLPSISVTIPARNETEDLILCLDNLIRSDYPKLEIVVLDDCSQNKHTPQIIKDYAQHGVKFISGSEPPAYWHAKTFAYAQLADQISGEFILFCGVDTRFDISTITLMVKELLGRQKLMVSFLPVNKFNKNSWFKSILIQPSRYFWELALPGRVFKRPPVLSTCWIINAAFLKKIGGFKAVKRNVIPESYLAKRAVSAEDGYSFLQSSNIFNLSSDKLSDEQKDTAIRTRYPQMHRRPELVSLLSLIELLLLLLPLTSLIYGLANRQVFLVSLAALNIFWLNSLYFDYTKLTYQKNILASILFMPVAFLVDILLLNYSMYRYEFKDVIWKGRNICLPVMRTYTALK